MQYGRVDLQRWAAETATPDEAQSLGPRQVRARLHCRPAQKGNSKQIVKVGGKLRLVSAKRDQRAERSLLALLAPHAPAEPLDGPLELRLVIHHAPPKSWPAWRAAAALAGVILPSGNGTPDCGNVLKLVEDGLQKSGWIVDDARTVSYLMESRYSQEPGYTIQVSELAGRCGPKTKRAAVPPLPERRRTYYSPSEHELEAVSPNSSRPCAVSQRRDTLCLPRCWGAGVRLGPPVPPVAGVSLPRPM